MKVTFPLRVLSGTVIPEPTDNPITVPSTLQPVCQIPGPLQSLSSNLAPTQQNGSFLAYREQTQAPSTASFATVIAILSAGLWEIDLSVRVSADFNSPAIVAIPGAVSITAPGASSPPFIIAWNPVLGTLFVHRTFVLNLQVDGWTFTMQGPLTAAAQNCDTLAIIYGKRLA